MIIRLITLLFGIILLSPANSWADKNYRVVVFGDSITSGYQIQEQDAFPAVLERKIRAAGFDKIEVLNMGGIHLSSAAATSETWPVIERLPDVVVVQLGFNDAKRGVLPSAIMHSLASIVGDFKRAGAYVVLVGVTAPSAQGAAYNQQLIDGFYGLAQTQGVAFYPTALEGILNHPPLTLADGMHPNTAGVEIMATGILPLVEEGLRWRHQVFLQEQSNAEENRHFPVLPPVTQ